MTNLHCLQVGRHSLPGWLPSLWQRAHRCCRNAWWSVLLPPVPCCNTLAACNRCSISFLCLTVHVSLRRKVVVEVEDRCVRATYGSCRARGYDGGDDK